jgi:hypothetical protein
MQRPSAVLSGPICNCARQHYAEPLPVHDIGHLVHECAHCHALHWQAEHVHSKGGWGYGICCNHGTVALPLVPEIPAELKSLLDSTDILSPEFCTNIQQYNSALAFTSLGAEVDHKINSGKGPYTFQVQG